MYEKQVTNPTFALRGETKEQLNQHNRTCEHRQRVSAFSFKQEQHIVRHNRPNKPKLDIEQHYPTTNRRLQSPSCKCEEKKWEKNKHLIVVVHSPFVCRTAFPTLSQHLSTYSISHFIYSSFPTGKAQFTMEKKCLFVNDAIFAMRTLSSLKSNGNERKISHSFGIIWLMHKQFHVFLYKTSTFARFSHPHTFALSLFFCLLFCVYFIFWFWLQSNRHYERWVCCFASAAHHQRIDIKWNINPTF